MVVPRFVRQALRGEPITIYGTGGQSRCFCYVDDVVEALVGLMGNGKTAGQVFNVGSTEEVTIEQLADMVIKLTGSKSEKVFVPYEEAYGKAIDDMLRRLPSIEKIGRAIGWKPRSNLDATLAKIVEDMRGAK
jgi:UDP-glucose 4-epimerase